MSLYVDGKKIYNSLVVDGDAGSKPINLAEYTRIGVTATNKAQSPVDANNYISVSGNTATLKRTSNDYHLWVYTPILLEAGKTYAIVFDNITNSDDKFYMEKTSDISVNPIVASRFDTVNQSSTGTSGVLEKGVFIKPDTDAYYGIAIWSQNTSDIVITNPRLIEI